MSLISNLIALMILAVGVVIVIRIIKELKLAGKESGSRVRSYSKIVLGGLTLMIVTLFIGGTVLKQVSPSDDRNNIQADWLEQQSEIEKEPDEELVAPIVKEESVVEVVPFGVEEREDSTIPIGETRVLAEGRDGEKRLTYLTTYVGDEEIESELIDESMVLDPITKIVLIGTYVAPASTPATTSSQPSSCGNGYYVNSQGNCVKSPSSNPEGASAKCRDGTYSYSQSRQGTCSHHGGVAEWY